MKGIWDISQILFYCNKTIFFCFSGGYYYLHVAKPGLDIPQATQKEQPDYVIIYLLTLLLKKKNSNEFCHPTK